VRGLLTCSVAAVTIGSCAHVDPAPEFAEAVELVHSATGVRQDVDPLAEGMTREAFAAVLESGLTLAEAESTALRNSRELQAKFLEIGVSKAEYVESGLVSNPSFELSALWPSGGGDPQIIGALSQNILDFWRIPLREEIAERRLAATVMEVAEFAAELVVNTRSSYYEVVAAEDRVEEARAVLAGRHESLENARQMRESGATTKYEENVMLGLVLAAELELEEARFEARQARRNLALILSADSDLTEVECVTPLPDRVPELPEDAAVVERAHEARLDVRIARTELEAVEREVELELRSRFPGLNLGFEAERHERPSGEKRERSLYGPTLGLELPVFNQNQAGIAAAEYRRVAAMKKLELVEMRVAREISGALDRVRTGSRAVEFYRVELLPQAAAHLQFVVDQFEAGSGSIEYVAEARTRLSDAHRQDIEIRKGFAMALADLEDAVGVPLESLCVPTGP